ncbi:MAG: C45 family peptidase, partial [Chthoniobacteraceae bacterium]
MKKLSFLLASIALISGPCRADDLASASFLAKLVPEALKYLNPPSAAEAKTIELDLSVIEATGVPKELIGEKISILVRPPEHLRITARVMDTDIVIGRRGPDEIWFYVPSKKFGLVGSPEIPRFTADPASATHPKLDKIGLPVEQNQIALLPMLLKADAKEGTLNGEAVRILTAQATPEAQQAFKLPGLRLGITTPIDDLLPRRLSVDDGAGMKLVFDVLHADTTEVADKEWEIPAKPGDTIQKVALAHLANFASSFVATLTDKIPTLGPEDGAKKVLATEGAGRLEQHNGTRVLFLKGTPEEMGRQHGTLMKKEVHHLVDRVLYGVGVGSSFEKGSWFFGEIENAQKRLAPFIGERFVREMDAMAEAAGLHPQEIRLANVFPELFHCSGFAIHGSATADGQMYHGRILDYLKGMGLEQNAVVIVTQPDKGNAWVNCGYAGFVGSVTAMNEKHLAIGEMGGRGEGNWDGKPMAQLLREVMENCDTLEQAVEVFKKGPRTCEYYYVISDAKSMKACGLACTPEKVEVIWSGESHPQLPHAIKDAVVLSAGDRYEELARRVQTQHGKLTADSARELMTSPVCMGSNIQSVLFAPKSLDFWVANADAKNVASHTR